MFIPFTRVKLATSLFIASQLIQTPTVFAENKTMHEFNFTQHPQLKTAQYAEDKGFGIDNFKYSSENTMLLALILEKVTKDSVSNYLQEKVWKKLGMEAPAEWSLDRDDEKGVEKAFCCLQARTKDFAKFARLYLVYLQRIACLLQIYLKPNHIFRF